MNKTIEDLEKEYEGKEEDLNYFNQQAVLGTKEEGAAAYDENGNFHCINWFDCKFCPAFNPKECLWYLVILVFKRRVYDEPFWKEN